MLIYKIVPRELWEGAESEGTFAGSPVDRQDGFIHFSTADQVRETASRHFAGQADLLLIAVETKPLESALRWEPSRGGALFPHLYGNFPLHHAVSVRPLPLDDASGTHVFPEDLA